MTEIQLGLGLPFIGDLWSSVVAQRESTFTANKAINGRIWA